MGILGKLVHIGIDAVLLSTVLAGIKRSTGLTCVAACIEGGPGDRHGLMRASLHNRVALETVPNKDLRRGCGPVAE